MKNENKSLQSPFARSCVRGAFLLSSNQQQGETMTNLFILKNDCGQIVFCGNKHAINNFLIAGDNYLSSSQFSMYDFSMNHIKTFITKR